MGGAVLKMLLLVAVLSCATALPVTGGASTAGATGASREALASAESFGFGFGWGPWGWPGYGLGYPFWG